MTKTITVKGIGKVTAKPDYVILSMTLESQDKDYNKAMEIASNKISQLSEALYTIGFEKGSIKTTNFNVRTDYVHEKDFKGNYKNIFNGYVVVHN